MRGKSAAKNIISSLFLQVISIVCGFIVPRLIIQTYGSETNGLINSITQFLGYIALLESGFGPVVKSILYKPLAKKDKAEIGEILKAAEKFFRRISLIFLVYLIGLCVFYPIIVSDQFDTLYTVSLIIIIAVSTFAEYFFGMAYRLFLQANQKTYVVSNIQVAATIATTILAVILIKAGFSIQIVKLTTAIVFIGRPLIQKYYVEWKYDVNIKHAKAGYKIKQKWDGLAQHIAAVIHNNTDIVVLTIFSTLAEVSVYSVYLMVMNGIKKIVQAFNDGVDASFGNMLAKGEHETLNRKFSAYELFYHTVSSIVFICTIVLVTPFVKVYTAGITDANYDRLLFGILISLAEFMWAIRLPYSSTVLAAGHFKQTRKGAWVEAILNISISVILVFNFGIVGVAIGTFIAMFVRTVEFMYHNSRHILKRNIWESFSWLFIIAAETALVVIICELIPHGDIASYLSWMKYALITAVVCVVIVVPVNLLLHRKSSKELIGMGKNIIKRRRK